MKRDVGQDVSCRNCAGSNDGLGFVLEMVSFLLLRPDLIVGKYIEEDGFLSDRLFASGNFFLDLDYLPTKSLSPISMRFSKYRGGKQTCWNSIRGII